MNYILRTKEGKMVANLTEETYKNIVMTVTGHFRSSFKKEYQIDEDVSLTLSIPGWFGRSNVVKLFLWKGMYLVQE
jgi:hypothetical protein